LADEFVAGEGPGANEVTEKYKEPQKWTSAAKAASKRGIYGTAEAVPLSKTCFLATSLARIVAAFAGLTCPPTDMRPMTD
jgi:hypothetical protein